MPYTLKSTGVASKAIFVVGVDDDNATIREFVSSTVNSTMTVDAPVSVGTATYGGVTRRFFETTRTGAFAFGGVRFGANKPGYDAGPSGAGLTVVQVMAGSFNFEDGASPWIAIDGSGAGLMRSASAGPAQWFLFSGYRGTATAINIPTDGTTKFTLAGDTKDGSPWRIYYGLEGGAISQNNTDVLNSGFGGPALIESIGYGAIGVQRGRFFLAAGFTLLSAAEIAEIHADPWGALFVLGPTITQQPVGGVFAPGAPAVLSVAATASSGSLTYQWQAWSGSAWVDLIGQTAASLLVSAPSPVGADAYRCVVTDGGGSAASNFSTVIAPTLGKRSPWGAL